jgi:hypothetical protein
MEDVIIWYAIPLLPPMSPYSLFSRRVNNVNTSGVGCVCECGRDMEIFSIAIDKIKSKRKTKEYVGEREKREGEYVANYC